ncbi:efflux RND transporter periplasmic adaptor subunit [Microbulbifer sp. OS29]|uniref:Efflux RND transporter periplasmic adaptor subunit n=1 Tax=Microbulbifer okhotskensis TaxID=2926617 RepID=A0A9X2J7B0_9GAMM|nr:efflux RND transporter periplasmic adaptor subunit [Microbulbifer okhotskensis]MCO1335610.1 efflux RND transporter periplasmic adaptor subunit [Microbulbifer okhotskensis]
MYRSLVFAALSLSLFLSACAPSESQEKETKPRPAVMVRPTPASAQADVYPGEIRARFEPALAFRISGKIHRRLVNIGDRVEQGQPLAELDTEDLLLQLDSARARLTSAEADQRLASSELARHRKLLERQLVSLSQFDTVETQYEASDARLQQAQAQLDVTRNQAAYAVLKAPESGVIFRRTAEAGQVVAAGQGIFDLAADGEREVRIDLPEQAIGHFKVGQPLTLELWSQPGNAFPAHIRELSPAADPISRTFEARVAFDNNVIGAEIGQSARVFAPRAEKANVLQVPMSAVSADDGAAFVWVLNRENKTLHKTPVSLGPYGEEFVSVYSGLNHNDWIVAAGTHLLQEGMEVRPVDRMNRPIKQEPSLAHQE